MFRLFKNKKETTINETKISYKDLVIQQFDKTMQDNFPQIKNEDNSEVCYYQYFYDDKIICFFMF